MVKQHIDKIATASSKLRSEVKRNGIKAILAAFAFVIALVWRDAIRATVDEVLGRIGIEGSGYIYLTITAIFVTVICVIGIQFFSKLKGEEDVKK